MPNDFKIIYKILKILSDSMDLDELDVRRLSPKSLGINENRRNSILEMLKEEGYVKGFESVQYIGDRSAHIDDLSNIKITLKGLEYLSENSLMKKAADIAKGIIGTIK